MLPIKHALIIALFAHGLLLTAPANALSDMEDKPATFDSLVGKGKWTVMEVWASDCRMCRATIHHTVDFETSNPDVDVIGVSLDGKAGKANAEKFIDEQGLTFTNLLSDPSEVDKYLYSTAKESFIGTPTFMVYNPQGKLLAVQPGAVTAEELSDFIKKQSQ
ncbi:TlpA family protein disulfide reductase [Thiothrix litoralis]|jgi:peroxiredoxin|uniref:TlpA family protein disulfide reductase n=1 Tax=Thiothrix litoralis TaxID=2891210 RepID=A0ABX7X251_9GAMM|nr:TlpA disulfide reductase family protein [Thiothrix litoralis]QTR47909.1 TlpA family protein disulfide reductase [Thiothrix litoralis]